MKVVQDGELQTIHVADGWTDIIGMSTTISVPSTQKAVLLITFSAGTACGSTSLNTANCGIQFVVDRGSAIESSSGVFNFNQGPAGSSGLWSSHSMQWVSGQLSAGSHTIVVEGLAQDAYFEMNSEIMSILRSKI